MIYSSDVQAFRSQLEAENRTSRKQSETLRKMEAQIGDMERTRHQETEKLRKIIDEKNQENLALQVGIGVFFYLDKSLRKKE